MSFAVLSTKPMNELETHQNQNRVEDGFAGETGEQTHNPEADHHRAR